MVSRDFFDRLLRIVTNILDDLWRAQILESEPPETQGLGIPLLDPRQGFAEIDEIYVIVGPLRDALDLYMVGRRQHSNVLIRGYGRVRGGNDRDVEPRLLPNFPVHGLDRIFMRFHVAPRRQPQADLAVMHQQNPVVPDDEGRCHEVLCERRPHGFIYWLTHSHSRGSLRMIPSERIYLLPYYHQFLRSGPAGRGLITSMLDVEGEWVHRGIAYESKGELWLILASRTATRANLITLFEHKGAAGDRPVHRVMLAATVPDAVVEGSRKLGVTIYRFPAEPKFTQIPCSLCGTRIDASHYPWRCPHCPSDFGSDYRLVICHRCGIPFRTSPKAEREVHNAIGDDEIWSKHSLCPDCRREDMASPVLGFDGTARNLILNGLLKGKLKIERLPTLGVPLSYVDRVIRPSFMRIAALPRGSQAAKALEMPPLANLSASEGQAMLVGSLGAEGDGSQVAISTAVDQALGVARENTGGIVNQLLEDEISALEQASRRGIARREEEAAGAYLERMLALPPTHVKPSFLKILDAIDADLVEAFRRLPERDLSALIRVGADLTAKVGKELDTPQTPGEDILTYLMRLKARAPPEET